MSNFIDDAFGAGHDHIFLGAAHEQNERRTWMVIGLCSAMMVVEIVGGTLFGSLALVADGILVREPHRGVVVAAPGAADVAEIYTARLVIEPAALRLGGGLDEGRLEALVAG